MADVAAYAVLSTVIAMLLLSVWRQFGILGVRGQILDSIGVLPQWKFFAQSAVAMNHDMLDDYHLLVRQLDSGKNPGPWIEIVWSGERHWLEAIWNPDLRVRSELKIRMLEACRNTATGETSHYQTSLPYLTLLRYCLDCAALASGQMIQFTIVRTEGRMSRPLSVEFMSAWHTR